VDFNSSIYLKTEGPETSLTNSLSFFFVMALAYNFLCEEEHLAKIFNPLHGGESQVPSG